MTARNRWSGLAPAVDAHLSRWGVMRRTYELTEPFFGEDAWPESELAERAFALLQDNDAGGRWMMFARSYGLPGKDGIPTPAVVLTAKDGEEDRLAMTVQEGATISGREQFEHSRNSMAQGLLLIRREYEMLDMAVSHYISGEVCEEIALAADEMPPETLYENDLFTPHGFAVLEHPVPITDLNYDTGLPDDRVHVHIRAIGWRQHGGIMSPIDGTVGEGVTLFLYTTPEDYRGGYCAEMAAIGAPVADPVSETDLSGPFIPVEVIPWRFGAKWVAKPDNVIEHIPGTVPSPVAFERRWFLVLMRLCWQQIVVHRAEHMPRQMHRKWQRLGKRKELLDYTTLRLRRVVDPDYHTPGGGVPLDHQVKVRGHKKMQWYPSLGDARLEDGSLNPESHKLIWIEAHWRGPEDGPRGAWHAATSFVR